MANSGLTLSDLIARGAKPVESRGLTLEELKARGAKPVEGGVLSDLWAFAKEAGSDFVAGIGQGGSSGFGEEAAALATSGSGHVIGTNPDVRHLREAEDAANPTSRKALTRAFREDYAGREERSPYATLGGELTGALATALIPGGAANTAKQVPLSIGRRLLRAGLMRGAPQGALYGAGKSEAETAGGVAADAGKGGVVGAVGGILGEVIPAGIGAGIRKLRRVAAAGSKNAVEAERAAQKALAEKNIASAKGSLGSEVQSASRDLEVLERQATALANTAEGKAAAAYLASPEGLALRQQVAAAKLESAPQRISAMGEKRAALDELVAGKDEAVERMTAEGLAKPVSRHVLPRLKTLSYRFAPAAIGGLGGAIGGAEGAVAGTILGGVMSATQGAPGRIIRNMTQKPAVQKAFWDGVLKATGGANPESLRVVRALQFAAARGPEELAATSAALAERSPAAQAILRAVAESEVETPETAAPRKLARR